MEVNTGSGEVALRRRKVSPASSPCVPSPAKASVADSLRLRGAHQSVGKPEALPLLKSHSSLNSPGHRLRPPIQASDRVPVRL